jgi:exodeoxyribonuclease VII small subunit
MAKKTTFEDALNRLEQITAELEEGDPSLDRSLKKFDEGVKLIRFCNQKLEEARKKVDLLVQEDNTLRSIDFPEEDDADQELS